MEIGHLFFKIGYLFLGTHDGYNWYNSGGTSVPCHILKVYLPYPEKCTYRTLKSVPTVPNSTDRTRWSTPP